MSSTASRLWKMASLEKHQDKSIPKYQARYFESSMKKSHHEQDLVMLALLHAQMGRLEVLKRLIEELASERQELNLNLNLYREVKAAWDWFFDHSLDMQCITTTDGHFKRVNQAFTDTLGFSQEAFLAHPSTYFIHPDDIEKTLAMQQTIIEGVNCVNFENRYRDSNGKWHWLSWRCPATTSKNQFLYAIARDVTESKRTEAETLFRALHDPLTGLSNRSAFEQELTSAFARMERNPANQVALLMIDLDGFKNVNDTYGHPAGDEALKQVSSRFASIQRAGDLVCRLGGDEFAWLAEGMTPVETEPLAQRLVQSVEQPINLGTTSVKISCSIGIATSPGTANSAKSLIAQADAAMYQAKKSGNYRIMTYA